jgi:hypothetical protein
MADTKKRIHSLVQGEGTIEGYEQLKAYITKYNKSLFGDPVDSNLVMDRSRIRGKGFSYYLLL